MEPTKRSQLVSSPTARKINRGLKIAVFTGMTVKPSVSFRNEIWRCSVKNSRKGVSGLPCWGSSAYIWTKRLGEAL